MSEESDKGFKCIHCYKWVPISVTMGTLNRNHCPSCLWSKHVDLTRAGDRLSSCATGMEPIALTFKAVGIDRYGKEQRGEIMIVHECLKCGKISINRIAADDNPDEIIKLLDLSITINENTKSKLKLLGINISGEEDREEIKHQIFGK